MKKVVFTNSQPMKEVLTTNNMTFYYQTSPCYCAYSIELNIHQYWFWCSVMEIGKLRFYESSGQLTGHMNMSKDYCPCDRAIPYSFNSSRLKIILRMLFQDHVIASIITDIVIGYWQDMWLKITVHEPSHMQMGPCSMIVYVVFT